MTIVDALDAYAERVLVGTLFDERPLRFRYADTWCNRPDATPIAPGMPLNRREHSGDHVHAYFENLLPEGEIRHFLGISRHATTIFGLLRSVGGDTAGGLTLLPRGETPVPARYRPTTWAAIARQLRGGGTRLLIAQNEAGARLSLAGAQDKLLVMVREDGSPAIPRGSAPSSHILKPDIRGLESVWCSALNETFCMQLAAALGLGVAETRYQPETKACLVRRYDRKPDESGRLHRLHQLDLCQLDGKPSTVKYESDGGPTLARCRELLQLNAVPATDLKRFLNWVFFNLYIGNHDGHAKNLAVLYEPGTGFRLAPFYDLMCTALYSGLSRRFAFRIGGESRPGRIRIEHLRAMAGELGFRPNYVIDTGLALARRLPDALESVADGLRPVTTSGTEQVLLDRLRQKILGNCRKLAGRWTGESP
jgi:serine/threonine-protein kinase HipA